MMATTGVARASSWAVTNVNKRLVVQLSSSRFMSSQQDDSDSKATAKAKLKGLLSKLSDKKEQQPSPVKPVNLAKPSLKNIDVLDAKGIEPEVVHAVSKVARASAETGGDDDDARQRKIRNTESELLSRLKSVARETEAAKEESEVAGSGGRTASVMADVIKNMKVNKAASSDTVQRTQSKDDNFRQGMSEEQMQFLERRKKMRNMRRESEGSQQFNYKFTDPFTSAPPLGIFEKGEFDGKSQPEPRLKTWQSCAEREIRIMSSLPPRNFLEDMARMTDRGEIWHFPIDNEQGVEQANLEPFYDHVFLEHHLEAWCPPQGALRHFMELVTVGLSKNPHISAEKKVEHINWYRDYFEKPEHKEILKASGAYDF